MNSQQQQLAQGSANAIAVVQAWIDSSAVDVSYKCFALMVVLLAFGLWDKTRKFTVWAAWIILFLLVIQQNQNPSGLVNPQGFTAAQNAEYGGTPSA